MAIARSDSVATAALQAIRRDRRILAVRWRDFL